MGTQGKSRWAWSAALAVVAIAAGLLWFWWPREHPIETAGPNPFVSELVFQRMDDGTTIGETIEIPVNTGFYALMSLHGNPARPETFDERKVVEPLEWSVVLVLYPRDSSPDADDALCVPCALLKPADPFSPMPQIYVSIPIGNPRVWTASGYDGPPLLPDDFGTEDELRLWTYFAVEKNEPGEYVYELTMYPTAAWRSSVRFEIGRPVVLQRGLLKVIGESA